MPILTSDFDRGRIHGGPAPGTERHLSARGSAAQPGGAMPCGPTMRRNQKILGRARAADLQAKGPRPSPGFLAARVPLRPACYLSRQRRPPRPPMPREGASQRERPAQSNKTEHSGTAELFDPSMRSRYPGGQTLGDFPPRHLVDSTTAALFSDHDGPAPSPPHGRAAHGPGRRLFCIG